MYDESVVVLEADDVQSPPSSAGIPGNERPREGSQAIHHAVLNSSWSRKEQGRLSRQLSRHSENSDEDDDDDVRAPTIQGCYDPAEYEDLPVSKDINDIFSYIMKYTPQNVELENKLCPFVPDFIPAVGDVDSCLKVLRPDGKPEVIGLKVLDEPCTQQSDPAILQLQLRAVAKQLSAKAMVVKRIDDAEKNGKAVDKWIKAINELHRTKPSPSFHYTKPMPNMDYLLQEWPESVEEKFNTISIPKHDLDCDLSTYVMIVCNVFDIPVYKSKIQSLHAFFTLYSTMKNTKGQLLQDENNDSPRQ